MSSGVSKKLAFHVKKEVKDLDIRNTTDESVTAVVNKLSEKYKEYTTYNPSQLRTSVAEAMEIEVAANIVKINAEKSKLVSLNQSLSMGYMSGSSKRQRPDDDNKKMEDLLEGDSSNINSNGNNNELNMTSGTGNLKKKKPSRKSVSDIDGDIENSIKNHLESKNPSINGIRYLVSRPTQRINDLAGIEPVLQQIQELVFYPTQFGWLYKHLGIRPPSGILLYGPTGCGKTSLANAIAGELNIPFYRASGPELVGGTTGESEEKIREIFQAAIDNSPSVLFIDSLDVIAAKRDSSQRGMDRRIVAQLFDCIDSITNLQDSFDEDGESGDAMNKGVEDINEMQQSAAKFVILIAAINKPDSLDPGVRGRFSREIALPVPDAKARTAILHLMTKNMRLGSNVNLVELGRITPGYVGADLKTLTREAGMLAVARIVKEKDVQMVNTLAESNRQKSLAAVTETTTADVAMEEAVIASEDGSSSMQIEEMSEATQSITLTSASVPAPAGSLQEVLNTFTVDMSDFLMAVKSVQPSAKREGFAVVPNVTWNDVGALSEVREELLHNVLEPIAHPERFRSLGLEIPAGVLFFGPPGCGKTLLAKALANQSGANFISVKGPELLNMYVGESESRVRQVFSRARSSAPCVIFFDEIDALCPKRGSGGEGSNVSERVVNQLLTELDGLEVRKDVYIIAATNRLELIDEAMLRPGRLGKLLYVPLPTASDRIGILHALTRNLNMSSHVDPIDIEKIATDSRAEGFSGADMAALVREAGLAVVKEWRDKSLLTAQGDDKCDTTVHMRHFEAAFHKVHPSVAPDDRKRYERVYKNIKSGMSALQALREAALHSSIKLLS